MNLLVEVLSKPFRPKEFPAEVREQVDRVVEVLRNESAVKEARIFGSAQKGKWDSQRSDIDTAVIIDGPDDQWSAYKRVVIGSMVDEEGCDSRPRYGELPARRELRKAVAGVSSKTELHIVTPSDLERMAKEGSPFVEAWQTIGWKPLKIFHKDMLADKLVYSRDE